MRVLHVVKTTDGAAWAAAQAAVLSHLGIEVHVALPLDKGIAVVRWKVAGAKIHIIDCSLPVLFPQRIPSRAKTIRELISSVKPDIIHSHFVTTTIMLRIALGRNHYIPRIFQVPGPLHLEYFIPRSIEISLAGTADWWVPSSRFALQLYRSHGVPNDRLFLSYYGVDIDALKKSISNKEIRKHIDSSHNMVVGNVNYMYPPKYLLGQTFGIKRHEDVIDALSIVLSKRTDVMGLLVGGQWGKGTAYEKGLKQRAMRVGNGRILMPGRVSNDEALDWWKQFTCVVHVPISENCGGVVEPLIYGIPVIASYVGGLPEVIINGVTGWSVPPKKPVKLAETILYVLDNLSEARHRADRGRELVSIMFDVNRTGEEIANLYYHILCGSSLPEMLNSHNQIRHV